MFKMENWKILNLEDVENKKKCLGYIKVVDKYQLGTSELISGLTCLCVCLFFPNFSFPQKTDQVLGEYVLRMTSLRMRDTWCTSGDRDTL